MKPKNDRTKSNAPAPKRFRITKLEERIAPRKKNGSYYCVTEDQHCTRACPFTVAC